MTVLQVAAVVMIPAAAAVATVGAPQAAPGSAKDGVYTVEQAARGKAAYEKQCAECHGTMATVFPEVAPLLNDHVFQAKWKNRSLAELFDRIRDTMPQSKPRTLSAEQTTDILALILGANGLPAGDVPLAHEVEALTQIRMDTEQP